MAKNKKRRKQQREVEQGTQPAPTEAAAGPEPEVVDDQGDEGPSVLLEEIDVLRRLLDDDLIGLVDRLPHGDKAELASAASLHVDPRHLRGRFGRLLLRHYRVVNPQQFFSSLGPWFNWVGRDFLAACGGAETFDVLVDEPDEKFDDVIEALEASWPRAIVVLWCLWMRLTDDDPRFTKVADYWLAVLGEPGDDDQLQPVDGATDAEDDESEEAGGSPLLFTPLDQQLIRATVATASEVVGAASVDELLGAVDEFIQMNADRHRSWFHAGFSEVLCGTAVALPEAASNRSRREWYRYGRVTGLVRLGDSEVLCREIEQHADEVVGLLDDVLRARSVAGHCILALLEHGSWALAVRLLDATGTNVESPQPVFRAAYEAGRRLADEGDGRTAQQLFEQLVVLGPWMVGATTPDGTYGSVADVAADLARRYSAASRSMQQFDGVTIADLLDQDDVSPWIAALLRTEAGFVEANIGRLGNLRCPGSDEAAAALCERVERGRSHFEAALELDPQEQRAALALGLSAYAAGRFDEAAGLLAVAERGFARDGSPATVAPRALASAVRAVCDLAGSDLSATGPSFKRLEVAFGEGYVLPAPAVNQAVQFLSMRDPALALELMLVATESGVLFSHLDHGAVAVVEQADAQTAEQLVQKMREDRNCSKLVRLRVMAAAIGAQADVNSERAEALLAEAADLVESSENSVLEEHWAAELERGAVRDLLGDHADVLLLHIYDRRGQFDSVLSTADRLFFRARSRATSAITVEDVLEVLAGNPSAGARLAELRSLVPAGDDVTVAELPRPVRVLWVGGNEIQQGYQADLDRMVAEQWDGMVTVDWTFPGWSSNWSVHADRVESKYDGADALALQYLVRTNLGRRLRRTSGEHGVPWVPCGAPGRGAMFRAIERAVTVAASSS